MNAESAAQETSGSYQRIEVRRITDALGAEVSGVNLSQSLDPSVLTEIRQALLDHLVICFRDQELSEAQLADFGRQFGSLEVEPFIRASNKEPGIHVTKGFHPDRPTGRTLGWHMDHTYLEVPTWGIALHGIDVPQVGNDTLFANTYLSYEALAPQMQVFFSGLTAIHDICQYSLDSGILNIDNEEGIEQLAIMRKHFPKVEHPLICTHPETGRKMIYFNPAWVIGIKDFSREESNAVVSFLKQHMVNPIFQCRIRWRNNTVAFWDNRCLIHSPVPDYMGKRLMQRVAIGGDWRPS